MLFTEFRILFSFLSAKAKLLFLSSLIFACLAGLIEIISLSTVLPFVQSLTTPTSTHAESYPLYLSGLLLPKEILDGRNSAILINASIFVFSVIAAAVFKVLNIGVNTFTSSRIGVEIGDKFFKSFLNQSFLRLKSYETSTVINYNVNYIELVVGFFNNYLKLASSFISSLFILLFL